MKKCHKKKKNI